VTALCSFMSTNPSHILIARNSRGSNNPSASLSSPTETHAAASGIFRSSGSPPWLLQECETDDIISELSIDDHEEAIEIDETFTKHSRFPGTVKIVVGKTIFWLVLLAAQSSGAACNRILLGRTKRCYSSRLPSLTLHSVATGLKPDDLRQCPL
jgi:hypothetical protein